MMNKKGVPRIDWLDPLKAFALLGVILNHLVEELKPGLWFTEPVGIWAGFFERVPAFVTQDSFLVSFIKILAWIGDFCPGVFILTSGFGLCWAVINSEQSKIDWKTFLKRRIFRLFPLYIFLHLLFLASALAKDGSVITFADPKVLFSMLGIRATDVLFFYINPSWWFIWLILQFYLVFPLLYILLRKLGSSKFLLLVCFFTLLSRLSGLLGLRYSESLYYWMLGIFFGTRLAEFCVGMVLATLLNESANERVKKLGELKNVFLFSILGLSLGLICFFLRYGNLIDYFLVTLGLSGLFYCVWKTLFQKRKLLSRFITILGIESYGIYLVHQLLLQKVGQFLSGEWRLIGLIVVILASFPIGIYLNRLTNFFVQKVKELKSREDSLSLRVFLWILSFGTLIAAGLITIAPDTLNPRFLAMIVGIGLILLIIWELVRSDNIRFLECIVFRLSISVASITLFILPQESAKMRLLLGVLVATLSCYIYIQSRNKQSKTIRRSHDPYSRES